MINSDLAAVVGDLCSQHSCIWKLHWLKYSSCAALDTHPHLNSTTPSSVAFPVEKTSRLCLTASRMDLVNTYLQGVSISSQNTVGQITPNKSIKDEVKLCDVTWHDSHEFQVNLINSLIMDPICSSVRGYLANMVFIEIPTILLTLYFLFLKLFLFLFMTCFHCCFLSPCKVSLSI